MKTKPSILPGGMKLVGDVRGAEDFVVFGTIEGEVNVEGAVVVEASGTVRGNVHGRTVAVRGVVIGDASALESLRVDDGGRMVGDVHAPRVNIVKGARFRGHVHMTGPRPPLPADPRPAHEASRERVAPSDARRDAPTMPGSIRAVLAMDTVVGEGEGQGPRRPPPPRMPGLRRVRARRKES